MQLLPEICNIIYYHLTDRVYDFCPRTGMTVPTPPLLKRRPYNVPHFQAARCAYIRRHLRALLNVGCVCRVFYEAVRWDAIAETVLALDTVFAKRQLSLIPPRLSPPLKNTLAAPAQSPEQLKKTLLQIFFVPDL